VRPEVNASSNGAHTALALGATGCAGPTPEERLAGLGPEERLQLLRQLGERAAVEGKLPAEVLEALRKYIDGMP
jgi:hypothetical protein